jgi:hypothetical protein
MVKAKAIKSFLIMIVLIVLGVYGIRHLKYYKPFDSTLWKSADSSQHDSQDRTPKQYMLKAAISTIEKLQTKEKITSELGPGENTGYFIDQNRDMIYYLGPERSIFSIDSEWLLIWFDDNDVILKYEIVTD